MATPFELLMDPWNSAEPQSLELHSAELDSAGLDSEELDPEELLAPTCSSATQGALETERVLKLIGSLCATDLGHVWVAALAPTASEEALGARRSDVEVIGELTADQRLVVSSSGLVEIRDSLRRSQPSVDGVQARQLAQGIDMAEGVIRRVGEASSTVSIVASSRQLADLGTWSRETLKVLDQRGEVDDQATPKLASLVASARTQRSGLRQQLESYARGQADTVDDTVSLREGRMTVLVRATSAEASEGVRHGSSGSGHSVYLEPLAVVEANNKLRQTSIGVEQEKRRILREILDFVVSHRQELLQTLEWLGQVDGIEAIARWRGLTEGCWAEVSSDLRLEQFSHPLLDPRFEKSRRRLFEKTHIGASEPLSIAIEREHRLLVITGPNAGGKTVAIKTVGLAAVLNQSGVPLPAKFAALPLFEHVGAIVGDDQDLMTAKSTFSGRLERLRNAWERASLRSLIVIDELGSGTDPEEGSALAVALLEELSTRQATVVVTTHLIAIATFAAEHPQGSTAAMAFDPRSGEPTFQLVPGPPGESHALDLARRLGLPEAWLQRAEELVGSERVSLSKMMDALEVERNELQRRKVELGRLLRAAEQEQKKLADEHAAAARSKEEFGVQLRRQQDDFERQALRRIDRRLEELGREVESSTKRISKAERGKILAQAIKDQPKIDLPSSSPVEIGDRVRHRVLSWSGTVIAAKGKEVQVAAGGKKIWIPQADLTVIDEPAVVTVKSHKPQKQESTELHLLGYTVDEALEVLDDYLVRAHSQGLDRVRVIHGHGTGRLRKAVRDFVRRNPVVAEAEPAAAAEGGNGATIVSLAD